MVLCGGRRLCKTVEESGVLNKILFIITILILSVLLTVSSAQANDIDVEKYNEIIDYVLNGSIEDENSMVTRGDCIAAIMRLIGVDTEDAEYCVKYILFDQPLFLDLDEDIDHNAGYIIIAALNDVAVGKRTSQSSHINKFESFNSVTFKECLTFMLRCLTADKSVEWDNVVNDSLKTGLLLENEISLVDKSFNVKQFYELLYRMLNQNRGLYVCGDMWSRGIIFEFDRDSKIRYIDWHMSRSLER